MVKKKAAEAGDAARATFDGLVRLLDAVGVDDGVRLKSAVDGVAGTVARHVPGGCFDKLREHDYVGALASVALHNRAAMPGGLAAVVDAFGRAANVSAPGGRAAPVVARPRRRWLSLGARGAPYPESIRELERDGASGVYLIRDAESGELLYVGESHTGHLYGTLTRHFQTWSRGKRFWDGAGFADQQHDPGVTYERDAVEVAVEVTSERDAYERQNELIRELAPRDNVQEQVKPDDGEEVPF